jgi:hypothetical protein
MALMIRLQEFIPSKELCRDKTSMMNRQTGLPSIDENSWPSPPQRSLNQRVTHVRSKTGVQTRSSTQSLWAGNRRLLARVPRAVEISMRLTF